VGKPIVGRAIGVRAASSTECNDRGTQICCLSANVSSFDALKAQVAARGKLDSGLLGVPRPATRNDHSPDVSGGGPDAADSVAGALAWNVISDARGIAHRNRAISTVACDTWATSNHALGD
jgi:hypothetical protein